MRRTHRNKLTPPAEISVLALAAFAVLIGTAFLPLASLPWLWLPVIAVNLFLLYRMAVTGGAIAREIRIEKRSAELEFADLELVENDDDGNDGFVLADPPQLGEARRSA